MLNPIKTFLIPCLVLLNCGLMFSQQTRLELGDKYFDELAYKKAIRLYEEADTSKVKWNIYAKLGDCYYYTSKPTDAIRYYKKLIQEKPKNIDSYRLKYVLSLLSLNTCEVVINELKQGNDERTIEVFAQYVGLDIESDFDSDDFKSQICNSERLLENSELKAEKLTINSDSSDFGTFIHKNSLFFASSRKNPAKPKRLNKRIYKWHDQPYLDIYEAIILDDTMTLVQLDSSKIDNNINTASHQGGVTLTDNGQTMFYAGGETNKNKLLYNKQGTSTLKLQSARLIDNKWVPDKISALNSLNLKNYSVANPALSPFDKRLFFVTCAPFSEAKGQTDIYYVDMKDGKPLGEVKNVPCINTSGRESFPFISDDGALYYSSDGVHANELGYGLLDIYKVNNINEIIEFYEQNRKCHEEIKIENLGAPFNSQKDDFAFFRSDPLEGDDCTAYDYFSSNREDSDDDIYRVKVKIPKTFQGTIADSKTGIILEDAVVELFYSSGMIKETLEVSASGTFEFELSCDQTYSLRGSKARYEDDLLAIDPAEIDGSGGEIKLELKPFPCEIKIEPLEFESKAYSISSDEEFKFSPLLELLWTNPDLRIRIESHTDSEGSNIANLKLSQKRAESTRDYLIKNGVKRDQILSAVGLGENCPLFSDAYINNLATKKEKEEAHRKNRRSRIILEDCEDYASDCKEEEG